MEPINLRDVQDYVNDHIGEFHTKRIRSLDKLELLDVLKRKNPYLYKAKNMLTSEMIVRGIVDAHISSNEETIFGDWLEELVISINHNVYGGWKSGIPGIDLEFDLDQIRYIVAIKSGSNWANSSQLKKLRADFVVAKRTLRTSNAKVNVIAINGCCYGRDNKPDKGDYFKYCGQKFWQFISGSESLYTDIIEPLGFLAKQKNDEYQYLYSNMINRFTRDFSQHFCLTDGAIDWQKLVRFNSSIKKTPV